MYCTGRRKAPQRVFIFSLVIVILFVKSIIHLYYIDIYMVLYMYIAVFSLITTEDFYFLKNSTSNLYFSVSTQNCRMTSLHQRFIQSPPSFSDMMASKLSTYYYLL